MTCAFEDPHRALDIDVHIGGRALNRRHDVANSREVKNIACIGEQRIAGLKVKNIANLEREVGIIGQVSEIRFTTASQIVDDSNAIIMPEHPIDHMAADEARAAGDDNDRPVGHAALSVFSCLTLKYQSFPMLSGSFPSLRAWHNSRTASSILRLASKPSTSRILSELMW